MGQEPEQVVLEFDVPVPGPDASVAELVRHDLAASTLRLLRHEHTIRLGKDPEGEAPPGWDHEEVHQARVATRRWRSTLRTFAGMLDPDWAGRLSGELSWLAGLLGAARDADVLLAGFERDLARLPDEDAEAGRRLLKRLVAARAADHGRLLAAMEEPRHAALVDDLVAAVRAPAWTPQAGQPATEAVPPLVARHWRRLRRAVDGAGDHASDEALHRIRIRAKRCRYAAEAAVPVIGEPARAFAKAVERLQEVLGEQHDAVVAEGWLHEAAASARRQEAFVAGQLAAAERARAEAAREHCRQAWKAASRKRLRAWL